MLVQKGVLMSYAIHGVQGHIKYLFGMTDVSRKIVQKDELGLECLQILLVLQESSR